MLKHPKACYLYVSAFAEGDHEDAEASRRHLIYSSPTLSGFDHEDAEEAESMLFTRLHCLRGYHDDDEGSRQDILHKFAAGLDHEDAGEAKSTLFLCRPASRGVDHEDAEGSRTHVIHTSRKHVVYTPVYFSLTVCGESEPRGLSQQGLYVKGPKPYSCSYLVFWFYLVLCVHLVFEIYFCFIWFYLVLFYFFVFIWL